MNCALLGARGRRGILGSDSDGGEKQMPGLNSRLARQTLAGSALALMLSTAAAAENIKIGVIQPLTGAFAASGTDVTSGAKIAIDEINSKGGVLGNKLELIVEDSKSNPT